MTTTSKTVLAVAVIAVVLLAGFFAYRMQGTEPVTSDENLLPTALADTSDSAMEEDAAAIDAQLRALAEDDADIEEGMTVHAASE